MPSPCLAGHPLLNPLIARYHAHWNERGYSRYAWPAQESHLRKFTTFFDERKLDAVVSVTRGTLAEFQRWLFYKPTSKGTPRAAVTINRALGAVRAFFKFLVRDGDISHDPAASLEYMPEPEKLPREILTPAEAQKIIETPDTHTLLGYRDRTILEVLYATALRKRELLNLVVADVNFEDRLLRVNGGKGAKDRVVPLTRVACTFLSGYINSVRSQLLRGRSHAALFISLEAAPLGRTTLDQLVSKYARLSGVQKKVTPHIWRHTCATHLVRNRANLRLVQELLGHRALTTTERYLHLTITDLKEAHRRFHPRERGHRT